MSSSAAAQQGFVQIVSGTLVATGAPERTGMTKAYQPDFGFSLFRPQTEFGTIQMDLYGVRSEHDTGLGRMLFAVRDLKAAGLTWKVDLGDTSHTPFLTGYGFSNLFAPQVTFRGATVSAVDARTSFDITAGRVTVFRDLFGADAETLGQTLVVGRLTEHLSPRFDLVAHVSSVRTQDLKEFGYLIRSGDDAGAGFRYAMTPRWQIVADAGLTSYVRRNETTTEREASALAGVKWTGANGSLEIDAHRFSPGNFSVVNNSYNDREGAFAAGSYNVAGRLRIDGGWDLFRTNLDPTADPSTSAPLSTGTRVYGGFRLRVTSHLFVGGRLEDGSRRTTPARESIGYESDTGSRSGEVQLTFSRWGSTFRYERHSNVDMNGGQSIFAQDDASAQAYVRITGRTQLVGSAFVSERHDNAGGGQSFWQANTGAQVQLRKHSLFVRSELMIGRSRDYQSDFLTPRTAISVGMNGQISTRISLSIDSYIDCSPIQGLNVGPWATRTLARLVYTLPSGPTVTLKSGRVVSTAHGTAIVEGVAFIDWNGNGVQDPGEPVLSGVVLMLDDADRVATDRAGSFSFVHQPAGRHVLSVDVSTVPASYDPPASTTLEVNLARTDRRVVAFGFLPVGDIEGQVFQDANGNRIKDEGDVPVEGAVLVLDDGTRTEVTHEGSFRFSDVRLGSHTVRLLQQSLDDGLSLSSDAELTVQVTQEQMKASVNFPLKQEKRPEIRKVFPPKK